ncbi:MAG: hypothetical protein QMC80_08610 [Thermoplasmatales archaeon]|nr:hypothetical protein [Thermoplasmatales archaeon]
MKAAQRIKWLAWKSRQKNVISDIKNKRRSKSAQMKWSREKAGKEKVKRGN